MTSDRVTASDHFPSGRFLAAHSFQNRSVCCSEAFGSIALGGGRCEGRVRQHERHGLPLADLELADRGEVASVQRDCRAKRDHVRTRDRAQRAVRRGG